MRFFPFLYFFSYLTGGCKNSSFFSIIYSLTTFAQNNLSNPDHGHFQKEGKQTKNEIISNKRESPKQNDIFHLPFMIPFEEKKKFFFVQNNFIFFFSVRAVRSLNLPTHQYYNIIHLFCFFVSNSYLVRVIFPTGQQRVCHVDSVQTWFCNHSYPATALITSENFLSKSFWHAENKKKETREIIEVYIIIVLTFHLYTIRLLTFVKIENISSSYISSRFEFLFKNIFLLFYVWTCWIPIIFYRSLSLLLYTIAPPPATALLFLSLLYHSAPFLYPSVCVCVRAVAMTAPVFFPSILYTIVVAVEL